MTTNMRTDVLVIGSGLAGICAALAAARSGARVVIASNGHICSGSSFYPGTWGLGLVSDSKAPGAFAKDIFDLGHAISYPRLVDVLVRETPPAISWLESLGVKLREPTDDDRGYIPCFDDQCRDWHGFVKQDSVPALRRSLEASGVRQLEGFRLVSLLSDGTSVRGALGLHKTTDGILEPLRITAHSTVLATGGLGGLYARNLNTSDVRGMGHFCALDAGATLVNLEFQQIMLGFLSPAEKCIYNEKLYGSSRFVREDGESVFAYAGIPERLARKALRAHALHGPFTSSRVSRYVDIAIYLSSREGGDGVRCSYGSAITRRLSSQPELVRTYLAWFRETYGCSVRRSLPVAPYAHASNGGVRIDEFGSTGVDGLYACGEAAGGVHGADRIGGLASAAALAFGLISGTSAAEHALSLKGTRRASRGIIAPATNLYTSSIPENALAGLRSELGKRLDGGAMVVRTQRGLDEMLASFCDVERRMGRCEPVNDLDTCDLAALDALMRTRSALELSRALVLPMSIRRESRGAHFRADYPEQDPQLARRILVKGTDGLSVTAVLEENPS